MQHKYSTFVGGLITLHMLFMFLQLSTLRTFWVPFFTVVSKGFVMVSSLDGPRDSHLCLVCLLYFSVCVLDYFC